jgi:hypothetical protein
MRASDLLGRPVIDAAGHRVGVVTDRRCIKEAAPAPPREYPSSTRWSSTGGSSAPGSATTATNGHRHDYAP